MSGSSSIRLMSYNIHHGQGRDGITSLRRIADEIGKARADVVALQEVDRFLPRSGFRDQAALLADMLKMNVIFAPSVNLGIVQYGNAVLSPYPIVSHNVRFMSGAIERRSLLTADVRIGERSLTVLNTHLGVHRRERVKQLPVLLDAVKELKAPAIVTGDFNMRMDDPMMKPLHDRLRRIEPEGVTSREIDHIFVLGTSARKRAWVQHSGASDHDPVVAELGWNVRFASS